MPTIGATVTDAGVVVPDYADILQELKIQFWQIYGADANLAADTQDGQFLAVIAQAIYDSGLLAQYIYNGFSPSRAQAAQLSTVVKINGLKREVPSRSTATVHIVGQGGRQIDNGVIGDNVGLNTKWDLPAVVVIDALTGEVDVTATCQTDGAVTAAADTLTEILTPTRGWQSVTNSAAAAPGQPVENDAQLRSRQSQSTALPALSVLDSTYASIAAIAGVIRLKMYENDSDVTDANGIPSHSISAVVSGGDADQIAEQIALKKTPGTGTFGSTSIDVIDAKGIPNTISFFPLEDVSLDVEVHITALAGYVSTTEDVITSELVAFVNGLDIGEDSYTARLYTPANLGGIGLGATYVVTSITQAKHGDPPGAGNVVIDFNEAAMLLAENVAIVVA